MEEQSRQLGDSTILMDYLPKLIRLAERRMSARLQGKVGTDEMANSILGSVVRMARDGKLQIEQSEGFWKLLMVIAKNKIRKKVRFHNAKKRDMRREKQVGDESPPIEELIAILGTPSEKDGELLSIVLQRLDERLDEDCRVVLAGKLDGKKNLEIASMLGPEGKSTKTVTRCWMKVEEQAQQIIDELDLL